MAIFYCCNLEKYTQGKRLYDAHCSSCHMAEGNGLGELYPSLHNSSYLTTSNVANLPCLIKEGRVSTTLSTIAMPPNKELSDAEMTNLINYIYDEWGTKPVPPLRELQSYIMSCNEK